MYFIRRFLTYEWVSMSLIYYLYKIISFKKCAETSVILDALRELVVSDKVSHQGEQGPTDTQVVAEGRAHQDGEKCPKDTLVVAEGRAHQGE